MPDSTSLESNSELARHDLGHSAEKKLGIAELIKNPELPTK
jgi:hypothetical protein